MFEINAGCGVWPWWPTPAESADALEALLRAEGIDGACSYPIEGLFWPDPQEANERRLPELAASPFFVPSAVINPTLPNALKSCDLCQKEWSVPMVRIFPGYHSYDLENPAVDALAARLADDGIVLGIHVRMQDERTFNPIAQVPPVPVPAIVNLAQRYERLRIVVFCLSTIREYQRVGDWIRGAGGPTGAVAPDAYDPPVGNLWVDISFLDSGNSLQKALSLFPADRLLFGTHAPLFYARSGVLKIENALESDDVKRAVGGQNARELLGLAE